MEEGLGRKREVKSDRLTLRPSDLRGQWKGKADGDRRLVVKMKWMLWKSKECWPRLPEDGDDDDDDVSKPG